MLDAYTVRKAVPRILLAVIGINLSIYLCIAAIDITNVIGRGLGDLLTAPFLQNSAYDRIAIPDNATNSVVGIFGLFSLIGIGATGILLPALLVKASIVAIAVLLPFIISIALISIA